MSEVAKLGRIARTLRHLRVPQALAQVRHVLAPRVSIASLPHPPGLSGARAAVPFLAPARHVSCQYSEAVTTIALLNREVSFRAGVDWDFDREGPLWAYHLHQFDYARTPNLSPAARAALMLDWVENHASGIGWEPHPTAHRVLSWGKLLLTPDALLLTDAEPERIQRSLADQIETLSRHPEVRLQANHLFTDLLAVVFGGLLFDGPPADRWLGRSDALGAELRDQVHPDGSHEERSPMYHALLLEQVLDLLNLAQASSRAPAELVEALAEAASRMCGALELWTHPDAEIALFSDSAFGVAASPGALVDYATALKVPVRAPEQPDRLVWGGFVRFVEDPLHLIVSVAGPAPEHQPGHAHCDALAFELSVDGERVVTDTGVFEYLPGERRDRSRATRAHATIEVAGSEQAELWAAHRVGGRPIVRVSDYARGSACEAICEGWATRAVLHRRRFEVSDGELRVQDTLEGPTPHSRLSLPLAPGLSARLVGGLDVPTALRVRLARGGVLQIDLPGPGEIRWRLEGCDYFPEFGRSERRWCLVGESETFTNGTWRFRVLAQ